MMEAEQRKLGENQSFEHIVIRHSEDASASNKNIIIVTQQEHRDIHQYMLP